MLRQSVLLVLHSSYISQSHLHAFEVEVMRRHSPKHDSSCMPCPFRSWKVAGNIQTIRPHETASWSTCLHCNCELIRLHSVSDITGGSIPNVKILYKLMNGSGPEFFRDHSPGNERGLSRFQFLQNERIQTAP